jgi:hypothetical protein
VDGDPETIWNAGAGPVSWIEIDLGELVSVSHVRLYVGQDPAGATEHLVLGRSSPGGELTLLGTLTGQTTDYQVLDLELPTSPSIRFLRISTTTSPSWVAWREIEVTGP